VKRKREPRARESVANGNGVAVWQRGIPPEAGCFGKKLPCRGKVPRRYGMTNHAFGVTQAPTEYKAHTPGRACTTRQSPLSILRCVRKLGIRVPKGMCLPREISHVALERRVRGELAEGRVIDPERMREVSRGHSSRWNRAGPPEKREKYTRRPHPDEGPNGTRAEWLG